MVTIAFEQEKNRSAAYDGTLEVGECSFSPSEKIWIIDHTQVAETHRGQQIAQKLVKAVVEEARNVGVKIIPLCPFAKKEFERNDNYADVLSGGRR